VGIAGLATGVLLNLKANSMADDMKAYGAYSDGKESTRKTYETGAWIAYGAGAACLVAGSVLYYLGTRAGRPESSGVAFAPMVGPTAAGATVGGTF